MSEHNIILAGVARSGSTLACYLLNKVDNTVALHEPIIPSDLDSLGAQEGIEYIKRFFAKERRSALEDGVATSKSRKGKVPDNPMGGVDEKTGERVRVLDGHQIVIDKTLNDDFNLVIKQPGLFSGMLKYLVNDFECFATVRNPLGILQSWNTVNMAVTHGHAPAAERCDPVLAARLKTEGDIYKRQLILLSWYFEQFSRYLPKEHVILYEDVIASSGSVLEKVVKGAKGLNEPLASKNNNRLYQNVDRSVLAAMLLDSEGYYWDFYTKDDVNALLEAV